jgi:hypothetical protein
MRFSFAEAAQRFGAPTLGQHNAAILGGELGLGADELQALARAGVTGDRLPDAP